MGMMEAGRRLLGGGADVQAERAALAAELAELNNGTHTAAIAAMEASKAAAEAIRVRDEPVHAANRAIAARMAASIALDRRRARIEGALRSLPLPPALARFKGQCEAQQRSLDARWNELTTQPFQPGAYEALSRKVKAVSAALVAVRSLETMPLTAEELAERVSALRATLDDVLSEPDIDPAIAAAAAEAERQARAQRGWGF